MLQVWCEFFKLVKPLLNLLVSKSKISSQMDVPLLAGWNTAVRSMNTILSNQKPTVENYKVGVEKLFTSKSKEILALYPANADEQVA